MRLLANSGIITGWGGLVWASSEAQPPAASPHPPRGTPWRRPGLAACRTFPRQGSCARTSPTRRSICLSTWEPMVEHARRDAAQHRREGGPSMIRRAPARPPAPNGPLRDARSRPWRGSPGREANGCAPRNATPHWTCTSRTEARPAEHLPDDREVLSALGRFGPGARRVRFPSDRPWIGGGGGGSRSRRGRAGSRMPLTILCPIRRPRYVGTTSTHSTHRMSLRGPGEELLGEIRPAPDEPLGDAHELLAVGVQRVEQVDAVDVGKDEDIGAADGHGLTFVVRVVSENRGGIVDRPFVRVEGGVGLGLGDAVQGQPAVEGGIFRVELGHWAPFVRGQGGLGNHPLWLIVSGRADGDCCWAAVLDTERGRPARSGGEGFPAWDRDLRKAVLRTGIGVS